MIVEKIRRGYADGPQGQIHFQQVGAGQPVVLIHQSPMTSAQFDNVYIPLARCGFHCIGIDLPGFGMSDPFGFVPSLEDYAEAIPPVLDFLGCPRAVLVGHHTGALVATATAVRFPDLVEVLVLHGPMLVTAQERGEFIAGPLKFEQEFKALPGGAHFNALFELREGLANCSIGPERISDYVIQALMGKSPFWYAHHAAFQYDHGAALSRVSQPTLIMGNTGDMLYEHSSRALELRPDFSYAELEGGGVDIVDQQPETWSAVVASYLKSLRGGFQ